MALRIITDEGRDPAEAVAFLRERLAAHPATGYLTTDALRARRDAGAGYMDAVCEGRAAAEAVRRVNG